jgi:hypothetical protein
VKLEVNIHSLSEIGEVPEGDSSVEKEEEEVKVQAPMVKTKFKKQSKTIFPHFKHD